MKKKTILFFLLCNLILYGQKDYRIYFHRSTLEIKNEINRIEYIWQEEGKVEDEQLLNLGILYNAMGRNNLEEKNYGKKALELLEAYLKLDPQNPIAIAQKGTAYALILKDTWNIFAKKTYVEKVKISFEQAKKLETDKINLGQIIYQQASVYVNLPERAGLKEEGLELFEEVLTMYEEGEIVFLPEILVTIYYRIAKLYLEDNRELEGVKKLMKGYDILNLYKVDTVEAKEIRTLLSEYNNE